MTKKIRIAILDDHTSIIDGYRFRLNESPQCEVVATANYGAELEQLLREYHPDILLLDISVPISPADNSTYPMLDRLPEIVSTNPATRIIVISMHKFGYIVQRAIDAGVAGFVLKDDIETIRKLDEVIQRVHAGTTYFTATVNELTAKTQKLRLTSRQREVLGYFEKDPNLTTAEVAEELHIAHSTVRNLLSNIYERLEVRSLPAAIEIARQEGLLTPRTPAP